MYFSDVYTAKACLWQTLASANNYSFGVINTKMTWKAALRCILWLVTHLSIISLVSLIEMFSVICWSLEAKFVRCSFGVVIKKWQLLEPSEKFSGMPIISWGFQGLSGNIYFRKGGLEYSAGCFWCSTCEERLLPGLAQSNFTFIQWQQPNTIKAQVISVFCSFFSQGIPRSSDCDNVEISYPNLPHCAGAAKSLAPWYQFDAFLWCVPYVQLLTK